MVDIKDGAIPRDVMLYVQHYAAQWDPEERLIGSLRAGDLERACNVAIEAVAMVEQMTHRIAQMQADGTWDKLPGATRGFDEFDDLREYLERDLKTPLADEIKHLIFSFGVNDPRRQDITRLAQDVARLESRAKTHNQKG